MIEQYGAWLIPAYAIGVLIVGAATWLKCPAETSTTDKIVKAVTNGLAWPWLAWKRWKARKAEKEE